MHWKDQTNRNAGKQVNVSSEKNRIFLKRSKWIVDKTLEMAYFSNNHNNNNNIKPKKKIMQQTETNCGSIDDLKRK